MVLFVKEVITLLAISGVALGGGLFSRTNPPRGAVVVRKNTTKHGEFPTIMDAVLSLPNDTSSREIFVYPGVYQEQVHINRTGPLTLSGYTTNILTYTHNTVVISNNLSASQAGSNDLSGTLRVRKDDFSLYNIDVENTFGIGTQAVALAQNGGRVGIYASRLKGYQDTLYANNGTQVYLKGYIQGAVDFIFGGVNRTPQSYFQDNTIAMSGPGWVTASGRVVDDIGSYLFVDNRIVLSEDALNTTARKIYLGRPWRNYAKVIFKNTYVEAPLNESVWSIWNDATPNTENILFAEWNTWGPGLTPEAAAGVRPDFVTLLTWQEQKNFTIATTLGDDWKSWVDLRYLL